MKSEPTVENRVLAGIRQLPMARKLLMLLAYAEAEVGGLPRRLKMKAAFSMWPSYYVAELEQECRNRSMAKLLWQLRAYRFIETRRRGDRIRHVLTRKGIGAVACEHIKLAPKLENDTLLMVSFDIPERERSARNALRRFLRICGFSRWHDSLWVTDKAVRRLMEGSLENVRGGKWVTMYEAHAIGRHEKND